MKKPTRKRPPRPKAKSTPADPNVAAKGLLDAIIAKTEAAPTPTPRKPCPPRDS